MSAPAGTRTKPTTLPQELLTPREAADFLRWSLPTVYTYASRRKLPTIKVGRSLRFRRSDLESLVKRGERPALRPLHEVKSENGGAE